MLHYRSVKFDDQVTRTDGPSYYSDQMLADNSGVVAFNSPAPLYVARSQMVADYIQIQDQGTDYVQT